MGRVLFVDQWRREAPLPERKRFRKNAAGVRAHEGMLQFRQLRERIRKQAEGLSVFYRVRAPPRPEDMDLRIARVSLAVYLLDTLDRMIRVADSKKSENIYTSFESARKAVWEFLDDAYFSKDAQAILSAYQKCEAPLLSCASKCGIQVLEPEPAVESAKMKVADMIDNINGMFL